MKHNIVLAVALLFVAGCDRPASSAQEPNLVAPTSRSEPPNCLSQVWAARRTVDRTKDIRLDRHGAETFSCDGMVSASILDGVLAALRDGARRQDRAAIANHVRFPLVFIDGRGRREMIMSRNELVGRFEQVFTVRVLRALSRLDLADASLIRSRGIFFEAGGLWFTSGGWGQDPSLSTINHQAMLAAEGGAP